MTDRDLARLLLLVAADLERRAYPAAGLLRQAARRLHMLAPGTEPPAEACRGCGAPLERHEGRGRPRRWCSAERCQRLRRKGAKTTMASR